MEKRGQACGAEQVVWMAVSRWTHRGRTAAVHKYVGTQVQVEGQGERAPVACLRVEGGDVPAEHDGDAEGAWSGFGLGLGFRVRVSGLGLRVRVRVRVRVSGFGFRVQVRVRGSGAGTGTGSGSGSGEPRLPLRMRSSTTHCGMKRIWPSRVGGAGGG